MSYSNNPLVDKYIASFNGITRKRLVKLRTSIHRLLPNTVEDISYDMPTYRLAPKKRGILHFAAFKDHVGLYAILDPTENPILHNELQPYRTGKGTLQFKNSDEFPIQLIEKALAHHAAHFSK